MGVPVATPADFDTEDGAVDGVTTGSGTSFAAPIVSGAAAWLATSRRDLSNGQLADVLRRSAGSADRVEDPYDVYRVRLPARSSARIRVRPASGDPDLLVSSSSAASIRETRKIVARSRRGPRKTEAVTVRNSGRSARRYYVAVLLGETGSGLNTTYDLQFERKRLR